MTYSACVGNGCSAGDDRGADRPNSTAGRSSSSSPTRATATCATPGDRGRAPATRSRRWSASHPGPGRHARANAVLLITDGDESGECQGTTNGAGRGGRPVRAGDLGAHLRGRASPTGSSARWPRSPPTAATMTPYNANNPASLEAALDAIAGAVVVVHVRARLRCPTTRTEIYVFFEDVVPGDRQRPAERLDVRPEHQHRSPFHGDRLRGRSKAGAGGRRRRGVRLRRADPGVRDAKDRHVRDMLSGRYLRRTCSGGHVPSRSSQR